MNKHDNEQWRSFKTERPERGHYQISLVPRDGHKGFCMYAYFNGRDWFDEHNRQLDVSRYQLSFRPWCEDYEE